MPVVRCVLGKPYSVAAIPILVSLLAIGEGGRMLVDIFPRIDIPVASVL